MPSTGDENYPMLRAESISTSTDIRSNANESPGAPQQEWIPLVLKKSWTIPLAILCFLFVALLEALDVFVTRNQGISINESGLVFMVRYLPTFCVVLLSFVWKSMTNEIKKVTPWSAMSNKWMAAKDSVLVNYVNNLEILSLFSSSRRKHWSMFLAIFVGILTAIAVTAANALTYTKLSVTTQQDTTIEILSRFNFDGTLVRHNNTLAIPRDHTGARPYARVTAERQSSGQAAPYTSGVFAFDEFASTFELPLANASLQVNVSTFTADWNCQQLNLSLEIEEYGYFRRINAPKESNPGVDCFQDIIQTIDPGYGSEEIAWLNVAPCKNETDIRLLATFLAVPVPPGPEYFPARAFELICTPMFSTGEALVQVNASSGRVTNYTINHETINKIDINISMEALYAYLNNPTDARWRVPIVNVSPIEAVNSTTINQTLREFLRFYDSDPFFMPLTDGLLRGYSQNHVHLDNQDIFKHEVETLASQILVQLVSSFARVKDSTKTRGVITLSQSRLFLRQLALRSLQIILVIIGAASLLQSTLLRPKSLLKQNPGPIATTAITLAQSKPSINQLFEPHAVTSDKALKTSLSDICWQIQESKCGNATGPLLDVDIVSFFKADPLHQSGWSPYALRIWSKYAISVAYCTAITTLAILQKVSITDHGLCYIHSAASGLFDYAPTVILLLLSALCSGIDAAMRSVSSYSSLLKVSKKWPLLSNFQDGPGLYGLLKASRVKLASREFGFALIATSVATLLFPWIKIAAAGLYQTTTSIALEPIIVQLDLSLVKKDASYWFSQMSDTERASQYVEWTITPDSAIVQRPGALDNLVITNLTGWAPKAGENKTAGYEIEARVPAFAVNVSCEVISSGEFGAVAFWNTDCDNNPFFGFQCSTRHCLATLNITEKDQKFGGINFMGLNYSEHGTSENMSAPQCSNNTLQAFAGASYYGVDLSDNGDIFFNINGTLILFLADYSSVIGPVQNYTPINTEKSTAVDPSMFNVSLPTLRALSCTKNISVVQVNVTFAQSTRVDIGNGVTTLPWAPVSYIRESIEYTARVTERLDFLDYLIPASNGGRVSLSREGFLEGVVDTLNSSSLWPSRGSSSNFFQLLAAYGEYKIKNLTALLDANQLAIAAEKMYEAVVCELLTRQRPAARDKANATSIKEFSGIIRHHREVISQDLTTTIILEALLTMVFCCLLWVMYRTPSTAILPKQPDSIAARLSLLANSTLVQRLREMEPSSMEKSSIWEEKASLGWWKVPNTDGQASQQWRWGIDVGTAVSQKDWRHPPCESPDETSNEAGDGDAANSATDTQQSNYLAEGEDGDETDEQQRTPQNNDTTETIPLCSLNLHERNSQIKEENTNCNPQTTTPDPQQSITNAQPPPSQNTHTTQTTPPCSPNINESVSPIDAENQENTHNNQHPNSATSPTPNHHCPDLPPLSPVSSLSFSDDDGDGDEHTPLGPDISLSPLLSR